MGEQGAGGGGRTEKGWNVGKTVDNPLLLSRGVNTRILYKYIYTRTTNSISCIRRIRVEFLLTC